jgi:hypothetical protein
MFLNRLRKTIQISVMIFGRQFEIQHMPIINICYEFGGLFEFDIGKMPVINFGYDIRWTV